MRPPAPSTSISLLLLVALACAPPPNGATPPPADAPAKEVALAGAVVVIAAGDIAVCGSNHDEATATIVDGILKSDSAAKVEDAVLTLGDNAYPSGSEGPRYIFGRCFAQSWGSKRIMRVIHPSPGNHDFENAAGAGYYTYFGDRAGPAGKGYYSFDVGDWHMISLNSEILVYPGPFSPEATAQQEWLIKDLKDHSKPCTLAYFHQPFFTSGPHGSTIEVEGLWHILFENGVDLVLNGHDHHYERFLPQTPLGVADSVNGITEIISGTGGANLRGLRYPLARNSAAQVQGYYGILKLTLGPKEYRHAFLDTSGRVWDRGGGKCH